MRRIIFICVFQAWLARFFITHVYIHIFDTIAFFQVSLDAFEQACTSVTFHLKTLGIDTPTPIRKEDIPQVALGESAEDPVFLIDMTLMDDHLLCTATERLHLGSCTLSMKRLWEKGRFRMTSHFQRLKRFVLEQPRAAQDLHIISFCAHGKHRSVAAITVVEYCLNRFARTILRHLNRDNWGKPRA